MQRSVARLRKEYLFQKQKEHTSESVHASKERLRHALKTNTPIPGDLKRTGRSLKNAIELEDEATKASHTTEEDEYDLAGVEDPRVLLTTTHDPSQKLLQFSKELKLLFPNSTRINRGNLSMSEMMEVARGETFTDVIIIGETQGVPDSLMLSHLPIGPTLYLTLFNVIMRHDIEERVPVSEQYPHLIFENFTTKLGQRIQKILQYLFPVPKETSTRVMTFANENDFISFRHHTFSKQGKEILLTEIGPRLEMRPYQIKQGTFEMKEAEKEWSLAVYTNTSKKRRLL